MGLDKALQRIQVELTNNIGVLTTINYKRGYEKQKLDVIANDATYTDEQLADVPKHQEDKKEEPVDDLNRNYKVSSLGYGKQFIMCWIVVPH